MRSFDFLSAVLAGLVTLSAGYFGLRAFGLRLTLRLERREVAKPSRVEMTERRPDPP